MRFVYIIIISFLFLHCAEKEKNQQPNNPKPITSIDTLKWQGIYKGTVPSKHSIGMDMKLTLYPSNTYDLHIIFLEKDPNKNQVSSYKGEVQWEKDSSTFYLNELDTISNKFRIKKDLVQYLNPDGTPNTGQLAEFYTLKKKQP